ncbi:MAG: hypothetical protein AMJ81_09125 [Phycisphaerae bacterium SM23_33]|nr:MAG: hypothetical protein AMJ81_09125 [Phycisphaerae bacterium SM23_33]
MRQRMLAVVQGRPHDRVPFVQYSGLAVPDEEAWSVIGRSNMGILRWVAVHRCEHPNCRFETAELERDGRSGFKTVLHTPEGTLTQEKFREPAFGTAATREHFVREPEDYSALLAYLRDITVVQDLHPLRQAIRQLGQDGLPHTGLGRTPYQQLWVEWVSIQDLAWHLVEAPELMEEVIAAMTDVLRRAMTVACQAVRQEPIPYLNFGDNITAPVIGERYFRKYCLPLYRELADMLAETGLDIPVMVHTDGDLKPLWQAIGESKIRGLDSLSPPPDNDTSVAQAAALWPEMRLLVNFPSSVHLAEPKAIRATAERILAEGGHTGRLQIQISENVPPGRWKVSFPEIVQAIERFGRPGP